MEIDVNKCKYFSNENCIYDIKKILNCTDCLYYRLLSKTHEIEGIKQEKEELEDSDKRIRLALTNKGEKLKDLEQENEELNSLNLKLVFEYGKLLKENEQLKERLSIQQVEFREEKEALKQGQVDFENKWADAENKLGKIREIVSGNYEIFDPVTLNEIRQIVKEN